MDGGEGPRIWLGVKWVLGPGEGMPIDEALDPAEIEVDDEGGCFPEAQFEAYYVDMHGRRWRRRPTGQPERVRKWAGEELPSDDDSDAPVAGP